MITYDYFKNLDYLVLWLINRNLPGLVAICPPPHVTASSSANPPIRSLPFSWVSMLNVFAYISAYWSSSSHGPDFLLCWGHCSSVSACESAFLLLLQSFCVSLVLPQNSLFFPPAAPQLSSLFLPLPLLQGFSYTASAYSALLQDRDAQKLQWISRFVEELKSDKWVLPALKQIREICQLFSEVSSVRTFFQLWLLCHLPGTNLNWFEIRGYPKS